MPPSNDDEGVWRLLNPLSIRFSQPRIAPHFRDGHLLEETAVEVRAVPLEDMGPAEPGGPSNTSADGVPPYDLVIMPPFPAIRVISWMPKLRGPDGEALRDDNDDQMWGKRAWFALDNRRLWSLQTAAAKALPKRCCAVVRCLQDVPGTTLRELRKFRTTTEGRSIELGVRAGDTVPWCWQQVAPPRFATSEDGLFGDEGLFAEDLFDALQWAPQAVAAGVDDPSELGELPAGAASRLAAAPNATAYPGYGGGAGREAQAKSPAIGRAGHRSLHSLESEQSALSEASSGGFGGGYPRAGNARDPLSGVGSVLAGMARAGGVGATGRRAELAVCPEQGWEYIDPAGKIQGPFSLLKMRMWHEHGYFFPQLPMRCSAEDTFAPFAQLFPGSDPFKGCVVRYRLQ